MNYTLFPIRALQDNYIWALINPSAGLLVLVDPGEADPVIAFLRQSGLSLQGILITHHHYDHTAAILALTKHIPVPVWGPSSCSVVGVTHEVRDKDKIFIHQDLPVLEVMAIPGHTLDHLAYFANNDTLFCGDTLFGGGCGRLFEGSAAQLWASLQRLAALPDETKICCAHEYTLKNLAFAVCVEPNNQALLRRIDAVKALRAEHKPSLPSLLIDERQTNPFLRCHEEAVIQSVQAYAQCTLFNPIDVFAALRRWKDDF